MPSHAVVALGALVAASLALSTPAAHSARIEFQATRYNVASGASWPSIFPNLTTSTSGPGDTFTNTGDGVDSLSGVFQILHNHSVSNGSALFAGVATYTGGTGIYAGASGHVAFAGIFDGRTGATTVADYGYLDAPNLIGADSFISSSYGTPEAVSPLSGAGLFDLSGARTDTPFSDVNANRIDFPVSISEPFALDRNTADNAGNYLTLGPDGNFIAGKYFTSVGIGYGNSVLFAGFTFVTDGGGDGWDITGGSGVFAGRNVRANAGDTAGLEYVTDFAYVTARRLPEPPTGGLLLAGLAVVALSWRRKRTRG